MSGRQRPLFYGRLGRILLGAACLGLAAFGFITHPEYSIGVRALLLFFGISFVIGGVQAIPGCEITAIPNLFVPRSRQLTCWCPLFSPLDSLERRFRSKH
jgi:hypothetical protein